ncbi:response regulator [Erythrobacter rubeus]|uniref:Response regulator transcription factor n=1 Tax=Erythrobacter rubeus TaxID=2760803 RepID=A0ABR8KKL9_9SPHN|nr:response regulator transcription factor [Erythrobacter rubeus]MBD2840812.1 response regulator transcription factor [Erythrobacter rubeus]
MSSTSILIVDDHQLAREGLKALLVENGRNVIGIASTGEEAIRLAQELVPEVILMDVRLGSGIDGLEATRQIAALGLSSQIIMLTLHDMPGYVREALVAGASGYVLKDTAIDDLCSAIDSVLAGQSALPIDLVSAAMKETPTRQKEKGLEDLLTKREQDVVELIAEGLTNKEIARRLEISPATVKVHVERIIGKLGVTDRTQAAVKVVQMKSEAL